MQIDDLSLGGGWSDAYCNDRHSRDERFAQLK